MSARLPAPEPSPADPRIAAACAGDRQAAESLLAELLPRVRNLVRYLVRGDGDVDDVAQESLIAIMRGLPGYRGEGKLSSWADRVVARATFAYLGRMRAERGRRADQAQLAIVPDPSATPDQYTLRRQAVRMLDRLPDEQRHVLVLHHVVGLSVPELAEELGVPFDTAKSRLRLGMEKLRAIERELTPGGES